MRTSFKIIAIFFLLESNFLISLIFVFPCIFATWLHRCPIFSTGTYHLDWIRELHEKPTINTDLIVEKTYSNNVSLFSLAHQFITKANNNLNDKKLLQN